MTYRVPSVIHEYGSAPERRSLRSCRPDELVRRLRLLDQAEGQHPVVDPPQRHRMVSRDDLDDGPVQSR